MSTSSCTPATLFIDLASFGEFEGYVYGGMTAVSIFVASIQKSNWMAHLPVAARCASGCMDFGAKNVCSSLNRSGDYVLGIWFRAKIPKIELRQPENGDGIFSDATVRWTRNLMHNLFSKISITFNELSVQEFDSYWLDMNFQFRCRGSKRIGYRNMIGDIAAMTNPAGIGAELGTGGFFNVPLPFFFGEDTGIALPVAALPFNDIKINYDLRSLDELLVVYPGTAATGGTGGPQTGRSATCSDVYVVGSNSHPTLKSPQTFATYAVVHNDERVKMGDGIRDLLIHQVQTTQHCPFKDTCTKSTFDVRLSHAVVLFTFAAENVTLQKWPAGCGGERSNYTTEIDYEGLDPIAEATLIYENTPRVCMGSDYYSLVAPWFWSTAIPDETGYHMYSYAVWPWAATTPSGSTNYSKLANVSITYEMSDAAQAASDAVAPLDKQGNLIEYPDSAGLMTPMPQQFQHLFYARNHNIARVANGSLGHPTL
jgi:hypothetical protein